MSPAVGNRMEGPLADLDGRHERTHMVLVQ